MAGSRWTASPRCSELQPGHVDDIAVLRSLAHEGAAGVEEESLHAITLLAGICTEPKPQACPGPVPEELCGVTAKEKKKKKNHNRETAPALPTRIIRCPLSARSERPLEKRRFVQFVTARQFRSSAIQGQRLLSPKIRSRKRRFPKSRVRKGSVHPFHGIRGLDVGRMSSFTERRRTKGGSVNQRRDCPL